MKGLALVGFMGTGKSLVGQELATRLVWPHVDTDEWIERTAGKPITQIFSEDGEASFRDLETDSLQVLIKTLRTCVVSTGGGVVLADRNWPLLHAVGPVVCLTAGVEEILRRVGPAQNRPLLAGDPAQVRTRIETLLAERRPAYARADWACATDGKTPAAIAEQIIQHFQLKPLLGVRKESEYVKRFQ